MGIIASLYLMVIGFIAWQGKRQIGRLDKLETRVMDIEERTNVAVNDMKDNYRKEFTYVRKDISELKESNAIHFGDLKCSIAKIETTVQMKHIHREEGDS